MKASRVVHYAKRFGLGALGTVSPALAQNDKIPMPVQAEFHTEPAEVRTGQPAMLVVTVRDGKGNVVRDMQVIHEKMMHLIVVSVDLNEFAHLHPAQASDGSFRVTHTFEYGGDYRLYADFAPEQAEAVIDKFSLAVNGIPRPSVALVAEPRGATIVEKDGLRLTLTIDKPLRSAQETMLNFKLTDARSNMPVTDLQPYLGALAHFVIISQDAADFLHAHPMEKSTTARAHEHDGHASESHTHGSSAVSVAEVSAHTKFPRPGLYKVWAQFQRNGRVITAPFVVRVDA